MGLVTQPHYRIHRSVKIADSAQINVSHHLVIGPGSVIGEDCEISGRDIEIGAYFWMDKGARIGGGSCYGPQSKLRVGHFLHMGWDSFINTARPVEIGDEVGLGTRTAIYTHGAYLSILSGFPVSFAPVKIGSQVWIPGATVNPGVTIGSDVVIGVGSVVTTDIPSGSLAAGVPAKVIRENAYPGTMNGASKARFWNEFFRDFGSTFPVTKDRLTVDSTVFRFDFGVIEGRVTEQTEAVRDQLRRYGIRFYSWPDDGWYVDLDY